ncbi:hypothetical protein ACIQM0_07040 [Streptomyces sp. NPDC091387]|uniref:hypothetical protein n=1 Tax=Streptomyces sp. NPDC091387 TaxID=3365998 RepID=UPI003820CCD5
MRWSLRADPSGAVATRATGPAAVRCRAELLGELNQLRINGRRRHPVGQGRHGVGADPQDGRRKLVLLSPRGIDVLVRSAEGFDRLRAAWVRALGAERVAALESDLRTMAPADTFRLDVASWFNG